jgi:hypothetical protein
MTEQFMEDLTNEEHERLMLMSEHAVAPPLSPAAQAVLDGFRAVPTLMDGPSIAGALRAAADQVVPTEMDLPPIAPDLGHFRQHERRLTRQRFLAIAAELEGTGA